jgi:hypothetical protein
LKRHFHDGIDTPAPYKATLPKVRLIGIITGEDIIKRLVQIDAF